MTKRIVPITFLWHVPSESANYILITLESFIRGIQDSGMNVYERVQFTIEETEDPQWSKIRGRYGFDGTTSNQKGQLIQIATHYVEVNDETH